MTDTLVRYEQRGDVAVLTLDDGKANAITHALIGQLGVALDRAAAEAKAVIIAGRPGRFSAGFDLRVMGAAPQDARALVAAGGDMLMRVYLHPQPVVIACTGHALAAGALLVIVGDTRIGVAGPFKIGLNEVSNGLPVPIVVHELARERLDPREIVPSVLQAKLYDPEGACAAGWLDQVVAPEALEAAALAEAQRLAQLPGHAYAFTKRSLRARSVAYMRETMDANLLDILKA